MMLTNEAYFEQLKQDLTFGAETNQQFLLEAFINHTSNELIETGFIEDFEPCYFKSASGRMRVDGFSFEDTTLNVFVADFESRNSLDTLTKTDINSIFRKAESFINGCWNNSLVDLLEITSPVHSFAYQISERENEIEGINIFLISERILSTRLTSWPNSEINKKPISYQIWDISRLNRQASSRNHKEILNIDFQQLFGHGLPSLQANLKGAGYESYLLPVSGEILAELYKNYGSRLLEQNVRTFLQARGAVNKGIRQTILTEPEMFFAYNNGITATAQEVELNEISGTQHIVKIKDLQIVNGGQTTASLYHTQKKDKADLSQVFVQMKLSVIDKDSIEKVVPKISQYANTQNKVNAADFFSNHPFHIRFEEFSRRIWAPAKEGAQRESKWFYERARGQYSDAQSVLTPGGKKHFRLEYPKSQMFTKTDLAKFDNVWDEEPKWVNLGAQKNFVKYAERIGKAWNKDQTAFNELTFKRAVARGIIFRSTEKLVSSQEWYHGGYRANIVTYTLATLSKICLQNDSSVDFIKIWQEQSVDPILLESISVIAKNINDILMSPTRGISNISEWCKKDGCWAYIQNKLDEIALKLPPDFFNILVPKSEVLVKVKNARTVQKIDDGINAQKAVILVPEEAWDELHFFLEKSSMLTDKKISLINIAKTGHYNPARIPSEAQSKELLQIMEDARNNGWVPSIKLRS